MFCYISVGSVLIFVTRKANSEELAANLRNRDFKGLYKSLLQNNTGDILMQHLSCR